MKLINNLLAKYRDYKVADTDLKIELIKKIKEIINLEIELKDIRIKNSLAYLNLSPTVKTEILLNKKTILTKVPNIIDLR